MRSIVTNNQLGAWSPTMAATPARWTPQLTLRQAARNASPYNGIGPQGLKAVVNDAQARTAARFFSSGLLPRTCGEPGMPPCSTGTPQSALSGLGRASMQVGAFGFAADVDVPKARSLPAFCAPVRTGLSELEWLLGKVSYTSDVVRRAQFVYNEMNAGITYIPGTSGCERDSTILAQTIADLRADMVRNGSSPPGGTSTLTPPDAQKPDEINPMVKLGIIAGVAVAGIIGLAVVTGNVATITKVLR